MDKRKENKGTIGNNGGRKSKAEEQQLIEKLTPLEPLAFKALTTALEDGKDWAVRLFFQYNFGMPKQIVEQKNINIDAGKLTDEEIKRINDQLDKSY